LRKKGYSSLKKKVEEEGGKRSILGLFSGERGGKVGNEERVSGGGRLRKGSGDRAK